VGCVVPQDGVQDGEEGRVCVEGGRRGWDRGCAADGERWGGRIGREIGEQLERRVGWIGEVVLLRCELGRSKLCGGLNGLYVGYLGELRGLGVAQGP